LSAAPETQSTTGLPSLAMAPTVTSESRLQLCRRAASTRYEYSAVYIVIIIIIIITIIIVILFAQ